VYGLGVVTTSDAERTVIEFKEHGTKMFVTSLMSAELIGEPPARVKRVRRRKKATAAA
jgi:hypothetical protein